MLVIIAFLKVGNGASGKVLDDSMMYQYNGKIGIGTTFGKTRSRW